MKLVLLFAIAGSLMIRPFAAIASCSMLNPCHEGHSCCPQHEPTPVPESCVIHCAVSQAMVTAKPAMARASVVSGDLFPAPAVILVGAAEVDRKTPLVPDEARFHRLCVLRR